MSAYEDAYRQMHADWRGCELRATTAVGAGRLTC